VNSAWKLRALVYGLLLVVAALVLVQRASTSATARVEAEPVVLTRTLVGRTAQGSRIGISVRERRVLGFSIASMQAKCRGATVTIRWAPRTDQHGVSYVSGRYPGTFVIHEGAGAAMGNWMSAWLSPDTRRMTGWLIHTGRDGCRSRWVRFSARR
jgi:hypothetical protein